MDTKLKPKTFKELKETAQTFVYPAKQRGKEAEEALKSKIKQSLSKIDRYR